MELNNNITGARFIAETLKGYGVTHIFYVDAILRKTMVDLEELGIRRIITHEDPRRPLSDQRIAEMLKASNIDIARRTVTKYREAMNILSSTKRRQIG